MSVADDSAGPPPARRGGLSVFQHRAFLWIWSGALVSNLGNWMETVAQSWLVQQQTHSAFLVEVLSASEFVPAALLLLWAGRLADTHDRRKLLIVGQTGMMLVAGLLAVLAHLHLATAWVVIAISFAEGAAWSCVQPAWQTLTPSLVPREELPQAIALNSAQFNTARLAGPILAGVLLTISGAPLVFDLNTLSFVAIVCALWFVQLRKEKTQPGLAAGRPIGALVDAQPSAADVTTALKWARASPGPRRVFIGVSVFTFCSAPVQGLLSVQLLVPEGLRGRGMSLFSLSTLGFLPVGHLLAGAIAHRFGVHAAVMGMASVLTVFSAWSAISREPAIDALAAAPHEKRRSFRAGVWETLTAESHWTDKLPPGS